MKGPERDIAEVDAFMEPLKMEWRRLMSERGSIQTMLTDAIATLGQSSDPAHVAKQQRIVNGLAARALQIPRDQARVREALRQWQALRDKLQACLDAEREGERTAEMVERMRAFHRPFDRRRPGSLGEYDDAMARGGHDFGRPTPGDMREAFRDG